MRVLPLPYETRLDARALDAIDLVVIHCTELPDLATARAYGERVLHAGSQTGNSGHWYVDRDGDTQLWVRPDRIAHHVRGYNPRSVGIELVNRGRWPDWLDASAQAMDEAYPDAQVEALSTLLDDLCRQLPALRWIAGHEDLDRDQVPATDDASVQVLRKRDPGPLFPWARVMAATCLQRLPLDDRA